MIPEHLVVTHFHTHTHTFHNIKATSFVCYDKDMLVFCPGLFLKPCIFSHISLLVGLKAAVRHCVTNKNYFLHARKILLDNYTTSVCKNAGIQTKFRPLGNVEHVLLSKQNRKSSLAVPVLTHPGRVSHICDRCQSNYWMR